MATGTPKPAKRFTVKSVTSLDTGALLFEMLDDSKQACQVEVKPKKLQNVWSEGSVLFIDSLGQLTAFYMRDAQLAISCAMTLGNDPVINIEHAEPEQVRQELRDKAKFIQIIYTDGLEVVGLKDDGTVWCFTKHASGWVELK